MKLLIFLKNLLQRFGIMRTGNITVYDFSKIEKFTMIFKQLRPMMLVDDGLTADNILAWQIAHSTKGWVPYLNYLRFFYTDLEKELLITDVDLSVILDEIEMLYKPKTALENLNLLDSALTARDADIINKVYKRKRLHLLGRRLNLCINKMFFHIETFNNGFYYTPHELLSVVKEDKALLCLLCAINFYQPS